MSMWSTRDVSRYLCVFVAGCDGLVAGATMAALSNKAELMGAMYMGRLLMRRRVPLWSTVSPTLWVCYIEDFSVLYTLRSTVDILCGCSKNERGKNHIDGSQLRVCLSVLPRPKLFLVPIGFYRSYLMSLSLIICSLIRKWQPCRWYW